MQSYNYYIPLTFIHHLSKENKQFIAFQLLLDMLLRLDQTSYAKQELLQFSVNRDLNLDKIL